MSKNTNLSFLTDYITADITNGRIGINTPSPTVAFDVTGVAKFSTTLTVGGNLTVGNSLSYGYIYGPSNQIFGSIGANTTWLNTGTSGLRINNAADNATLAFISNTGNVGIGTSSPSELLTLGKAGGGQVFQAKDNTTNYSIGYIQFNTDNMTLNPEGGASGTTGYFRFITANSERMRITSGGNVGIGTTSPSVLLHAKTTGDGYNMLTIESTSGDAGIALKGGTGGTSVGGFTIQGQNGGSMVFVDRNSTPATRMTISSNGSIGAPSGTNIYNASDIRLKQNISTTTYGLDAISALNPVKFNWVDGFEPSENGKDMLGFIAQEVQSILPEAIESFGGNSITIGDTIIDNPLRVNEKFLIPVLVKAIQELRVEIEKLKQK